MARQPAAKVDEARRARKERDARSELSQKVAQGARPGVALNAAARAAAAIAGEGASAAVYLASRGSCPRPSIVAACAESAAPAADDDDTCFCLAAHAGPLSKEILTEFNGPPHGTDRAAFRSGKPRKLSVLRRAKEGTRCARLLTLGYRAVAVLPIVADGEPHGIIRVAVTRRDALDDGVLAALAATARIAAVAIERRLTATRAAGRVLPRSFGKDVRAWLAGTIDLEKLLSRIVATIAGVVDAPQCFVILHDPEARALRAVAATAPHEKALADVVLPLSTRRSLAVNVFKGRKTIAVFDALKDRRVSPRMVKRFGETSLLGIPLVVRGEAIGVVMIAETRGLRRFSPDEIASAEEICSVAALAIENARRHRDARLARERAELLLETVRDCQSGVDLHDTMRRIARRTIEVSSAERCSIYLADEAKERVAEIVHHGWPAEQGRNLEGLVGSRIDEFPAGRAVLRGRKPLVFDDIGAVGGIPNELAASLGVRAAVVVPVRARGEYLAAFAVGYPSSVVRVPRDEVPLLESVANQVALALANARAFAELARQRVELDVLTSRMIGAQEEERRRIARELHDGVSQTLTAAKFELERHLRRPEASEELRRSVQTIGDAIGEVRRLCVDLRPSQLDHLGLAATLEWYGKAFAKRTGIATDVQAEEALPALAPEIEINMYRIIQEALSNVAKHADATHVTVRIRERARRLEAIVQDDGRGFDPATVKRCAAGENGMGLLTMAERAHLLGGELQIKARPGRGTVIEVSIPLRRVVVVAPDVVLEGA